MSEESLENWKIRVYNECLKETGPFLGFWMWAQGNHPEIVDEWMKFVSTIRAPQRRLLDNYEELGEDE